MSQKRGTEEQVVALFEHCRKLAKGNWHLYGQDSLFVLRRCDTPSIHRFDTVSAVYAFLIGWEEARNEFTKPVEKDSET